MNDDLSWFSPDSLSSRSVSGIVQAVYRFRYIALQYDYLKEIAGRDISWFGEDKSEEEYIPQEEELNRLFHRVLQNDTDFVAHEVRHHSVLKESTFWIYINLCETWRRLICISCAIKKTVSSKDKIALFRVMQDKILIKKRILSLEEHRQALEENVKVREDVVYERIRDVKKIEKFYSSMNGLKQALIIGGKCHFDEIDILEASSDATLMKIVHLFYKRQVKPSWFHAMPFAFRMLRPDIFFSFTTTLISNLTKFKKIIGHPGFRTYNDQGIQVTFDPGSQFAGRKVRSDSLEFRIARKDFDNFNETIKWINYLTEKQVWRYVLKRAYFARTREYNFLSRWLMGDAKFESDLRYFERTVDDVLRNCANIESEPTKWMNECRVIINEKRKMRYPLLNDKHIYNLVDSYYVHGV